MRDRVTAFAFVLALALGGAAVAAQPDPSPDDVPWGDEIIEIDPSLCVVQGVVSGRHTDEKLGRDDRVTIDVLVFAPTDDGYAIAADVKNKPAAGEWEGAELGDELCLTLVEDE